MQLLSKYSVTQIWESKLTQVIEGKTSPQKNSLIDVKL